MSSQLRTTNSDYGSFYKNTPYNNTYSRFSSYNQPLDRGTYKLNTNKFDKRYDKMLTKLDPAYEAGKSGGRKRMFSYQNNNSNDLTYILNPSIRRIESSKAQPTIKRHRFSNSERYRLNNKFSPLYSIKSYNNNNSNNMSLILQPNLYRIPETSSPFNTKSKIKRDFNKKIDIIKEENTIDEYQTKPLNKNKELTGTSSQMKNYPSFYKPLSSQISINHDWEKSLRGPNSNKEKKNNDYDNRKINFSIDNFESSYGYKKYNLGGGKRRKGGGSDNENDYYKSLYLKYGKQNQQLQNELEIYKKTHIEESGKYKKKIAELEEINKQLKLKNKQFLKDAANHNKENKQLKLKNAQLQEQCDNLYKGMEEQNNEEHEGMEEENNFEDKGAIEDMMKNYQLQMQELKKQKVINAEQLGLLKEQLNKQHDKLLESLDSKLGKLKEKNAEQSERLEKQLKKYCSDIEDDVERQKKAVNNKISDLYDKFGSIKNGMDDIIQSKVDAKYLPLLKRLDTLCYYTQRRIYLLEEDLRMRDKYLDNSNLLSKNNDTLSSVSTNLSDQNDMSSQYDTLSYALLAPYYWMMRQMLPLKIRRRRKKRRGKRPMLYLAPEALNYYYM